MTSFRTKTRAIILSTLLICNKYSAIGDKITFFEPVYANDTNAKILPEEVITRFEDSFKIIKSLNLTKKETIESYECDQAITNLQHIMSTLKDYIDPSQITKLDIEVAHKRTKDNTARAELQSNIGKTIGKLGTDKKNNLENIESLYTTTGRFIQKIERKSKNDSTSATSTLGSTLSREPDDNLSNPTTDPTNSQSSSSAQTISSGEPQNSDQNVQVASGEPTLETSNVNAVASQPIEQGVETQTEPQRVEPDLLNEQGAEPDNNDNDSISDNDANGEEVPVDDNTNLTPQEESATAAFNDSDKQTQSSDSDMQSVTEDDKEPDTPDTNDNDSTTASKPVSSNNTTMIHDTDDNSYDHFTPTLHSTIHKARTLVFPQISRKVSSDRTTQQVIGASCSSNLRRLKRYEIEAKYLYSTTTIPKTNGSSKSNIHGLLINLKRQITSKLTAGVFYSPTSTNTTLTNKVNNNSTSGCMDHLFGVYTSYTITPATHLSNQIAFGITTTDNNLGSNNNKSSNKQYPNYFILDSFISHKINIDATKIMSPELGISYYQSNTHIPYDIGDINNLSLNIGIKFQYKYKYNNFELCPSIKINHVHPLYASITDNIKNLSNRASTPPTDLLRDLQSAFDPHSSIRFALSIRNKSIRLESGYGFITYHNIEHSYTHTFFAKLNLAL